MYILPPLSVFWAWHILGVFTMLSTFFQARKSTSSQCQAPQNGTSNSPPLNSWAYLLQVKIRISPPPTAFCAQRVISHSYSRLLFCHVLINQVDVGSIVWSVLKKTNTLNQAINFSFSFKFTNFWIMSCVFWLSPVFEKINTLSYT